jgi:hypothetical protein
LKYKWLPILYTDIFVIPLVFTFVLFHVPTNPATFEGGSASVVEDANAVATNKHTEKSFDRFMISIPLRSFMNFSSYKELNYVQ